MYPLLRVGAGLVAITALVSRLSSGRSLSELLSERIAVYPAREGSILDWLRDRLGLTPPPAPETPNPVEQLRREIEASELSPATKDWLLQKLKREGYGPTLEAYRHALAAPLRL